MIVGRFITSRNCHHSMDSSRYLEVQKIKVSSKLVVIPLLIMLLVISPLLGSGFLIRVASQTNFPNVVSYRVSGAPNYTSPGSEPFWNSINWTVVSLAASVSPGGGHTPDVLVKSANTGFDMYMLFRWNDSAGPSFL